MMIKTLDNVYINMEDFSGFTIGYPNDSDFTVMAMKELVDNQTATIELGRVKKKQEEKMLREKENFVVKYLLEFAAPEERNKFMGKNPNNVCLYDESEIRDVIAQMPEDIFLDFYGTFKFLYDENETSQEGK